MAVSRAIRSELEEALQEMPGDNASVEAGDFADYYADVASARARGLAILCQLCRDHLNDFEAFAEHREELAELLRCNDVDEQIDADEFIAREGLCGGGRNDGHNDSSTCRRKVVSRGVGDSDGEYAVSSSGPESS